MADVPESLIVNAFQKLDSFGYSYQVINDMDDQKYRNLATALDWSDVLADTVLARIKKIVSSTRNNSFKYSGTSTKLPAQERTRTSKSIDSQVAEGLLKLHSFGLTFREITNMSEKEYHAFAKNVIGWSEELATEILKRIRAIPPNLATSRPEGLTRSAFAGGTRTQQEFRERDQNNHVHEVSTGNANSSNAADEQRYYPREHTQPTHSDPYKPHTYRATPQHEFPNTSANSSVAKSKSEVTPMDAALQQLDAMGILLSDIAAMTDDDYKEFAASMRWTSNIALVIRSRSRQQGTSRSGSSMTMQSQTGSVLAPSSASKTNLAMQAELEEQKKEMARMKAEREALVKAAAVGTATRALADRARAEDDATYKKVTELNTHVSAHKKDLLEYFAKIAAQGTMEVCFVIDGTGSMGPYIAEVKNNIKSIADALYKSTSTAARFGVVVYRDYEDAKPIETFPFGSASDLENSLQFVKAETNCTERDWCEDCFGGLQAAVQKMEWSTPARVIIWTGDAPQHGTRYSGGCDDNHSGSTATSTPIATLSQQRNINIVFTPLTAYTDTMITAMQKEFNDVGATLTVTEKAAAGSLARSVLDTLKASAKLTCTKVGSMESGPERHFALNPSAGLGPEKSGVEIFAPQSCPTVAGDVHPLLALLAEKPKCATEKRRVQVATAPFAKGEMRYAFHCKLESCSWFKKWSDKRWVAKCAIRVRSPMSARQMHIQTVARFMAAEFNARLADLPSPHARSKVSYVPVCIMKLEGEHWVLEPYIQGTYIKFNNNYGAVMHEHVRDHPIPQAFSHFTFEFSAGHLLVSDIQGVVSGADYVLTDPAIHTVNPDTLKDPTNLGQAGMAAFFSTHACNDVCARMGLKQRSSRASLVVESHVKMMPVKGTHTID